MKFTPTEWEIIDHRLGAADSSAECLSDEPDDAPADFDTLLEVCRDLEKIGGDIPDPTELQLEVIYDCCCGCTFFADIWDEVALGNLSRGKVLAWFRAATSLEKKLGTDVTRH